MMFIMHVRLTGKMNVEKLLLLNIANLVAVSLELH